MDFTKGEVSEWKLRLIASACQSDLLIADVEARGYSVTARDERAQVYREGDKPKLHFHDFTFGEIHERFPSSKRVASGYSSN